MTRSTMLTVLLVLSTALFAAGAIAERNSSESHSDEVAASSPAHSDETDVGEAVGGSEEGGHAERPEEADEVSAETETHVDEKQERLLGIDLESTPLIVLATAFGLAFAAATALRNVRRRRELLLLVAAVTVFWAALDVRELVHQIDESRTGVASIAAAVAALHVVAAALAAQLSRRRELA